MDTNEELVDALDELSAVVDNTLGTLEFSVSRMKKVDDLVRDLNTKFGRQTDNENQLP